MATPDVAPRPAKAPIKPGQARKTRKPSAAPVLLLVVLGAILTHVLLSLAVQAAADEIKWHPQFVEASIRFGEAQFTLNAVVSFLPFDLFFGFAIAVMVGFMIRLPFFRDRVYHTVMDVKKRLMLQLSASQDQVEAIIKNDPENNQRLLMHRDDINIESVQSEIHSINAAQTYLAGKGSWMAGGLSPYMKFHFVEEYANKVQGAAYAGAAFLIIVIGIRGLKFIPATKPSPILFALGIEFVLLSLLAISLMFTEEEERTDRILKQMVDAVKGGKKEKLLPEPEPEPALQLTRGDYERIVREQMDKKILEVMSDKDDDALRRIALDLVSKG